MNPVLGQVILTNKSARHRLYLFVIVHIPANYLFVLLTILELCDRNQSLELTLALVLHSLLLKAIGITIYLGGIGRIVQAI